MSRIHWQSICGVMLMIAVATITRAQDVESPAEEGIRLPALQPGDEPTEPFHPLTPAPEGAADRTTALSWYMTGKIHEQRGRNDPEEFATAVAAYRRGLELDPDAIQIYQSLIPILYASNEKEEAREFALRAAQRRPEGFQLVRGLAAVMTQGDTLADAVELLQAGLETGAADPRSVPFLLVHRDLGLYLHMNERPEEAAESFRIVFDALHDDSWQFSDEDREQVLGEPGATYDEMGQTFLDAKLPDLAVRAFDEAAKYREKSPGIHSFNLALVFRETNRPEEGLAELDKYFDAQLQSKGRAAYQLLKDLLSDLDRSDQLLPRLEELYEEDPRNEFLAYFLAGEYTEADRLEQAEELYKATMGSSENLKGLVGLVPVYRRQQRTAELFDVLSKAYPQIPQFKSDDELQTLPEDARHLVREFQSEFENLAEDGDAVAALMELGRERQSRNDPPLQYPQAYLLGKLAIEAKRTDDVVNFYELAITMLNQPTLELFTDPGEYLIDEKQYDRAVDIFDQGAEHPAMRAGRWILLYFKSYALEFGGRTEEALAAIGEAQRSQPDNPQLRFQEAWIHYHARDWENAERKFKQLIEDFSGEDDIEIVRNCQFSLSNVYVQQGDMEKGEQVLEDVLKEDPDHPQANNDLGYLWADQGKNLEQARDMVAKALKAEPENAAYLDSMGWVLYKLEDYDGARKYLEQAADLPRGEDPTILDHLGDALNKLGEADGARQRWERALELEREGATPDAELVESLEHKLSGDAPDSE